MTDTTSITNLFNVLIVDDEPDFHAAVRMSLKHETVLDKPIHILSAYSKQEASELLTQFDGDICLVLLDVIMETENAGFELLAEIRASNLRTQPQVVMVTGQAGLSSERDAARHHDINAYLPKSDLNPYRLVSILNTSIRNYVTIEKLENTTNKLLEVQLKQEETAAYINSILDSISDALVVINSKGIIVTINSSVTTIFGYTRSELLGMNVDVLIPEPYASRHDQYLHQHKIHGTANIIGKGRELPAKKKNGQTFPMELTLTEFNNKGEILYIGLIRNISERIETQKEIYQLAYFDPVTNLPNLTNFHKGLSHKSDTLLAQDLIALALIDLSGFYRINQAYGHDVGDQVLTLLVDRMEWVLPKNCHLYRAEGSDFLVELNPNTQDKEATVTEFQLIAQELLAAVAQDVILGTSNHQISANIGILVRPLNQIVKEKVLHQLEFATLQAKKVSNVHLSIYDSDAESEDTNKYLLEQELSKAIDRNEFSIYLQPQYNCDKQLICSEALLRWSSNKLGFIPPDRFIHIAEDSGLIVPIGRWILAQMCSLIAQTSAEGHNIAIAINVSARELLQPDFVDVVKNCINDYKIPARAITLEVTESVFATDIETVVASMTNLSEFGVRFSIDDFGTGYSSLSYLKRLPINELKIDKSFIDDISQQASPVPLVDAIITMAKALGLDIVAEGVEQDHQFDYLAQQANMLIQGYLFSRPLAIPDWRALIDRTES